MTQGLTNQFDREFGLPESDERRADELGTLLDRLRDNALRLIAELPEQPRLLRVRAGGVSVEVEWPETRTAAALPAPNAEPAAVTPTPARVLTAPMVGVFYQAPDPGSPPFVRVGDTVVVGQQIGIVEAMKLMIPIEADAGGRVVEVLKGNGEPVEFGEPLFALDPS